MIDEPGSIFIKQKIQRTYKKVMDYNMGYEDFE